MNVQLVSITTPSPRLQSLGIRTAEDVIVHAARASSHQNQFNTSTGRNLIEYCMKHGHWSVFEQASMGVEIVTSRAISAQILRHRSFHFQEFSQRYAEVPQIEYTELRKQAEKNRQSSTEVIGDLYLHSIVGASHAQAILAYEKLLEAGVARECARMVLPMCAQTKVYMSGTVRDWIHYLKLRSKLDTQKEHREVAQACLGIFRDQFPVIAYAIADNQDL
jgi:thymidylate synthase (FAD)